MNERLEDGLYTAVGLGVLSVQRLQVQRRQVQRHLRQAAARIDQIVDPVLDEVQGRLPDSGAQALDQARSAARRARRSLLGE